MDWTVTKSAGLSWWMQVHAVGEAGRCKKVVMKRAGVGTGLAGQGGSRF